MTRDILSQFTEIGFRFNPHEIMKKNKEVISHTCSTNSFYRYHSIALQIGVSQGILLKNTDDIITDNPLGNLKSIHYWKKSVKDSESKKKVAEIAFASVIIHQKYLDFLEKYS